MNLITCRPGPPLCEFVELFWLSRGPAPAHAHERLLPAGTTELVLLLQDERSTLSCARLAGPHSEHFVIDTAGQAAALGVHFRPGGAFPFFKPPLGELHNVLMSLDAVWGRQAGELRERVLEADSPVRMFRCLEDSLRSHIVRPISHHPAVAYALRAFQGRQGRRVADVTGRIGLSQRRFIEVFKDEVGMSPKRFCRVQRFQQMLRRLHTQSQPDWARLALDCDYYDQAHFIHDFQAFSGLTPTAYLEQKGDHLNHVPIVK